MLLYIEFVVEYVNDVSYVGIGCRIASLTGLIFLYSFLCVYAISLMTNEMSTVREQIRETFGLLPRFCATFWAGHFGAFYVELLLDPILPPHSVWRVLPVLLIVLALHCLGPLHRPDAAARGRRQCHRARRSSPARCRVRAEARPRRRGRGA